MLKIGLALVAAVLLTAQTPIPKPAPSQHPPISKASGGNQSTAGDNRGSDERPLVVKIRTTPEGDKEAADVAKAANDQARNDGLLIKLTGALAFVAFLQWCAMLWQANLARQQISLSRAEFISSRRAWMAMPEPRLDGEITADNQIVVELLIWNRGSDPAIGVNHYGMAMMEDKPKNISYAPALWSPQFEEVIGLAKDLAVPVKGHATIFPGQYLSMPVRFPAEVFVPDKEVAALTEGKKILVMYGCIGYLTLGEPHYTPYCLYLTRDDSLPGKYRFGAAPIGNEAT